MDNYFYIDQNKQQAGPIDPSTFAANGVTGSTLVWKQGMAGWQRADSIPELVPYLQQAGADNATSLAASSGATSVAAASQGVSLIGKPSNNLWLAVASTLFCCQPLGIVAIHYAAKVDTYWLAGEQDAARAASRKAVWWSVAVIIIGVVLFTLFLIFYAAVIAASIKNGSPNFYTS